MKRKLEVLVGAIAASAVLGGVATAASSPTVVTGGTAHVGQTSAELRGTVNPNGSSTTYFFRWGYTPGYGFNTKPLSAGAGSKTVSVRDTAAGLVAGATYHYQLVATNQFGTTLGADHTFTAAGHTPPGVATGPATAVNTTGATLTGAVNPSGAATSWWFQWGPTTAYGEQTAAQALPAGAATQNVAASLQGLLAPGKIYHFRLVASHGGSVLSAGADGSFMTFPSPRPSPVVLATTKPGHARRRPYVFATVGTVTPPPSIPAAYGCNGNVTIQFFHGSKRVAVILAGIQPNCTFGGFTLFHNLPARRKHRHPLVLKVLVRSNGNSYLAPKSASTEYVKLG